MKQHGFTQLGKRLTGIGRREAKLEVQLSVVVVSVDGEEFSLHSIAGSFTQLRENNLGGEVILVDRCSPQSRLEQLLRDFPDLKILIPTEPLSYLEAFCLGAREAIASKVLNFHASCKPEPVDLPRLLYFFEDRRLFAAGFMHSASGCAIIPAFEQGRLLLQAHTPKEAVPALFLPDYCGMYDREKLLKIDIRPRIFPEPWGDVDFYYSAWSRGWITMVDPQSRFSGGRRGCITEEPAGFWNRLRFFRGETAFLRRNLVDSLHGKLRRRFFFRYSIRRLLHLDPAPALACLAERLRSWIPWKKQEKRMEAVFSASDIFALIREGL